jgi:hypothetical protein
VSKYVPALGQKCNNVPASRQKYNLITIYDMSLTLSTYNVLVIYKVLALACAWSKSDRKTTTACNNVPASRQKYNLQQYMICHLLINDQHIACTKSK